MTTSEQIALDLLALIAARTLPVTKAEAEFALAVLAAMIEHGVECESGRNGDKLCIPSRWNAEGWLWQAEHCRHCPVFVQHFAEQTH